jgi:hypothetical protein
VTPDQERRLRECAFDTDVNAIVGHGMLTTTDWMKVEAVVDALMDIRDILNEPIPLHDPWDWQCCKNIPGEPFREGVVCPVCRPGKTALAAAEAALDTP